MNSAVEPACYHCNLSVPEGTRFVSHLEGQDRLFCCPGCQAVAETIYQSGLDGFYRFRSQANQRPDFEAEQQSFLAYDLPQLQSEFVIPVADDDSDSILQAQFLVEGITCAACVWLIEHHLDAIDGVIAVKVNAATGRATVRWRCDQLKLSEIMSAVATIGYRFTPATEDQQQSIQQDERRKALMRIGVAGFGMMQVGMVAVTIYAGASGDWLSYWRWISLIIATPVVFFSAKPFFVSAWRALQNRHLVMDVPVSLAIAFAYSASVWATISQSGEVYFDSVSMFTFFLLLGRYLEMRTRHKNRLGMSRFAQLLPLTATRIRLHSSAETGDREHEVIPLRALVKGDQVVVAEGDILPCDGVVANGVTRVDEALLTGEGHPVAKGQGDAVVAGSTNLDSPITVTVEAVGAATTLSAIEHLVEGAHASKPKQVVIADKLASWFVAAVLLISALTATYWLFRQPEHALWVVLSVLVVTCPCALSLATPTAHAAALTRMRQAGLLVVNSDVLGALANLTTVVFDKTGTLTEGTPKIKHIETCGAIDQQQALHIAAALEQDNRHPIARAFQSWQGALTVTEKVTSPSAGVRGEIDGVGYVLGSPEFVCEQACVQTLSAPSSDDERISWLLLARDREALAWFGLSDLLRPSAEVAVTAARQAGMKTVLLSGDQSAAVREVAESLGITDYHSRVSPEEKLQYVQRLQARNEVVLMVGDGINDAPVLSGADISVAMASATDLAQTKADALLLSGDLSLLVEARGFANRLRNTIKQNLTWALTYNVLALPLAVMGLIPPWAAAIGMSLSSLVVVANAIRLTKAPLGGMVEAR